MDTKVLDAFVNVDTSSMPSFHEYTTPLDQGLWILTVAKDELEIKKLTALDIAAIAREVYEVSISPRSLTNAFNRSKGKVHIHSENGETLYKIMKMGRERIMSLIREDSVQLLYFESGRKYTSKRELCTSVLARFSGELKIVDPYCGARVFDMLSAASNNTVKFLTRMGNLRKQDRKSFVRELREYCSENPNVEFRDYPDTDIHDRYIISSDHLVIMGHSLKDLGGKESFAVVLGTETSKNIIEALTESFKQRWEQSRPV